jgi:hypothetical protein
MPGTATGTRRTNAGLGPVRRRIPFAAVAAALFLVGPTWAAAVPSTSDQLPASAAVAATGPTGNNWSKLAYPGFAQPFGRAYAAVAFDPLGGVGVVYGGRSPNGGTLGDTWVNDGDIPGYWSNFTGTVTGTPPPLTNASLAYDGSDGYFVMFGGRLANGTASGATWELLGLHHWVDVTAFQSRSPPPQAGAGLAYDEADRTTVLLSGVGNSTTWTFRAGNWSLAPTTGSPSPRTGEVFLYDPVDRALILFGGSSGTRSWSDTWEFAGGAWRLLSPPTVPPAGGSTRGAWDPHGPGVLLFLGDQALSTWEYTNRTWSAASASGSDAPALRIGAQLYYDSVVLHDTLFGGVGGAGGTTYSDSWGWSVPQAPIDPTLSPAPISPAELGGLAAIVAVPIVVAWLLRRRPPRRLPVSVPRPSSRAIPGG